MVGTVGGEDCEPGETSIRWQWEGLVSWSDFGESWGRCFVSVCLLSIGAEWLPSLEGKEWIELCGHIPWTLPKNCFAAGVEESNCEKINKVLRNTNSVLRWAWDLSSWYLDSVSMPRSLALDKSCETTSNPDGVFWNSRAGTSAAALGVVTGRSVKFKSSSGSSWASFWPSIMSAIEELSFLAADVSLIRTWRWYLPDCSESSKLNITSWSGSEHACVGTKGFA